MPSESARALLSGSGARCMPKSRVVGIEVDRTGGGRGPEGGSLGIKPAFLQGQTSRMTTRTHPLFHVPVPWVFVLGYLLGALLERIAPIGSGWTRPVRTDVVGAVLFIAGVVVAGWGWFTFHRAGTTRVPGKVSSTMVTWGPYRFSRNPMYVGLSLAYLGEAGLLHQLWPALLLALTLAYLQWFIIPLEESKLRDTFGPAFDSYRATVRRWI